MNKKTQRFLVLIIASLLPATGFSKELPVMFGKSKTVSVVQAEAREIPGSRIDVSGVLNRRHRLPMAGHLHLYGYSAKGDLIAESQHRVLKLNSQRGGAMLIPFRFSVENNYGATVELALEYHSPGYSEKVNGS